MELPYLDCAGEVSKVTAFIRDRLGQAGKPGAVLGLSGGVDSAVVCALSVQALGSGNVYPLLMPYGALSTRGVLDGMMLAQSLGVPLKNIIRVDVQPAVDILVRALGMPDRMRRGNIMARVRMIALFDQAKARNALVVGTENRSEYLLGYFTRFGDEASDIEPIDKYYKTQVYELAKFLKIPPEIINQPPSAGLWPEQTDEGELGFSYSIADQVLSLMFDQHKSKSEIVASGYDSETVDKIIRQVETTAFKRK